MFPGKVVFEEVVVNDKEDRSQDGEDSERVDQIGRPSHSAPAVLLIGRLCLCCLKKRDQRDDGSCKTKNSEKMPQFAGQEVFTEILHVLGINFGSGPLSGIRIVLVLRGTFQQDTILTRDLEDVAVHFALERDRSAFSRS